jgi:hypothetical protein
MVSAKSRARLKWLAVALAGLAAGAYVLIANHILGVGDLAPSEVPAAIIYVAAGCYLLGGLLILLRWRWLWIFGAGVNALVVLIFVQSYLARPDVMFSPGGLVSKALQVLLELSLLSLIVADWRRVRTRDLSLSTGKRLS